MRKSIYISILACLFSFLEIKAQPIMSYNFECRQGNYEEISGGTIVGAGLLGETLQNVAFDTSATPIHDLTDSKGIPIGFEFVYNDLSMNKFIIGSHGYIILGKDQIKINPARGGFMLLDTEEGKENVLGMGINTTMMGTDTTQISYKTIGSAPDRILVVQFKNLLMSLDVWDEALQAINLQIRLHETSGQIEYIFKGWKNDNTHFNNTRIGLKGNEGDIHLRYSENNDWTQTELSTLDKLLGWGNGQYPADGFTYLFTPPANCKKPDRQASALQLIATSTSVKGTFEESLTADHYLVVMSEENNLTALPKDKSIYRTGDQMGNGIVISYGTETTFETEENLSGTHTYYFYVFAVNAYCSYGPLYNTVDPLQNKIQTLPARPLELSLQENGYDHVTLSATPNTEKNSILIAMTDQVYEDVRDYPSEEGIFGTPEGELNVGDQLTKGGTIIYKGEGGSNIPISNLENNTLYHFRAWSVDKDNRYSSNFVKLNSLTWGKLPYQARFDKMAVYNAPFGWDVSGNTFTITTQSIENKGNEAIQLSCNITSGNPQEGKINTAATQWILLNNSTNRIQLNYNLTTWSRITGTQPYNEWNEKDSLAIQISDNGTDYTTLYCIDKKSAVYMASATDWPTVNISFNEFAGKKVKIRFYWKTYAPNIKLIVENFKVEEKPECDYPVNVSVDESSIVGTEATVKWTSTGEENVWEIRYRTENSQEWNTPVEVRSNPYTLNTLPANSTIELQVRAKCSLTNASPWSQSIFFTTGYMVPFTENFDAATLPAGWSFENGILADQTEFCTGTGMNCRKNWMLYQQALRVIYTARLQDWVVTPKIDLGDGKAHSLLEFDLKLQKPNTEPISDEIFFALVISKDGGQTFSKENIVREWKGSDLEAVGDSSHYAIDLSSYSGIVKFGFYAFTSGSSINAQLYLDNIAFLETCPAAQKAKAEEITTESARITWEGEADEWLTFVRKAGENQKEYIKQTENKLLLSGLLPQTNYEVGITKTCAVNDTARIVIVPFTTRSLLPCPMPTEITATTDKQEATIRWTGEADSYHIRFRPSGMEEWLVRTTTENFLYISGLEPETKYEYMLQATCSPAPADTSEWTPIANFGTLPITCFAPTQIKARPTHRSAIISWEGEADNYQLAYRGESEAWQLHETINAKTVDLLNLSAATKYSVRLRSICAASDTSIWSAAVDFSTAEIPPCPLPTGLKATGMTDQTVILTWQADESNLTWDVRYREGSATSWNTLEKLNKKSCELGSLIPNTVYLWSVKATCEEGLTSAWAVQNEFTTQPDGMNATDSKTIKIYLSNHIINISNPEHCWIKHIFVYDLTGKILKNYKVESDEQVIIPAQFGTSGILIKVQGKDFTLSKTLMMD